MSPETTNNQGDQIGGDKLTVGNIGDGAIVAIGAGATAVYQGLTVEEVASLVVELKHKDQPDVWDGRFPYLGLTAFQESDSQFFFGRESLVKELLERVKEARFIVIAGPSGSGKSSVARAGLFHALREGEMDKSDDWLLATMQPKGDPIGQLAAAIDRMMKRPDAGDYVRENGRSNPLALHEQIDPLLSDDPRQRCVLLVDQFEETFTQTKEEDRAAFINLLTEAAKVENGRLTIILSLRADFVSHCARYAELRKLMSQQFQLVGAMDAPDLAKAITLPALEVGAEIDPKLVSQIMADMKGEPGALPLMSFALRDLFEAEKSKKGNLMDLTLPEYLERGGIESALERHANKVFGTFTDEQKGLARGVFSKLIEVGQGRADTRRTAVFSELIPAGVEDGEITAIVDALAQEGVRLITTSGSGGTVTIAHEKLIDAWPWLRQLVDENREMIVLQNQINDDATSWAEKEDSGYLYRGGRLIQVEEQLKASNPDLNELSKKFIQASLDQRQKEIEEKEAQQRREIEQAQELAEEQRQRAEAEQKRSSLFRKALIGGGVLLLFLLAAMVIAWIQTNTAISKGAEAATSEAHALAGEATALAAGTAEAVALADAQEQTGIAVAESTKASQALATATVAKGEAEISAVEAEQQTNIALARQLAAQSLTILEGSSSEDLIKGTLLAIESLRRFPTVDGNLAMRTGLNLLPQRLGETAYQNAIEISPDGKWLVTQVDSGLVNVLNIDTEEIALQVSREGYIGDVAFSADSQRLVVGSGVYASYGQAEIWAVDNWEQLAFLPHENSVQKVSFNSNGMLVATVSEDHIVRIWNILTEDIAFQLEHESSVGDVAFSPDDRFIAVGREVNIAYTDVGETVINEGAAHIWDVNTKEELMQFPHDWSVRELVFSPDGKWLATGSGDSMARVWRVENWQEVSKMEHDETVNHVAFSADSKWLTTSSQANTTRIWQSGTWQEVVRIGESSRGLLAPDQRWMIVSSEDGRIFELGENNASTQANFQWDVSSLDFSPENYWLAVGTGNANTRRGSIPIDSAGGAWTLNAETGEIAAKMPHENYMFDVQFSPDGEWVVTQGSDRGVRVWDPVSGKVVAEFVHENEITGSVFSSDSQWLATASGGLWAEKTGEAFVWDIGTQQQIAHFEHGEIVFDLAFSPDDRWLVTTGDDSFVRVWDISTEEMIMEKETSGRVRDVEFSSDGRWLAVGSGLQGESGEVQVWRTDNWQALPPMQHTDVVFTLTFSSNGQFLVAGSWDNIVKIWAVTTSETIISVDITGDCNEDIVHCLASVALSPDDLWLAIGSLGGIARIWEIAENKEIVQFDHSGWLQVAFSHDSKFFATGSSHKQTSTIQTWLWQTDDLIAEACQLLEEQQLSIENWKFYIGEEAYQSTCPD